MNINSYIKRKVVSASKSENIKVIVELMDKYKVGMVVLTNGSGNNRSPVGVITARDIALKVTIPGKNPNLTLAHEVMSNNILKIEDYASIEKAIGLMSKKSVKSAPIVDKDNNLVGIVSLDLLAEAAGNFLSKVCCIMQKQNKV